MTFGEAKNEVAQMSIWKSRVQGEMKMKAEWESNWGWLKYDKYNI
jgi:hypothetical protein